MIREHAFNSRFWGKPVGLVEDARFFNLSGQERQDLLQPYDWAEFRASVADAPDPRKLADSGFGWVDTQLHFRIALFQQSLKTCGEALEVHSAADQCFTLSSDELALFEHERYRFLPGITAARLQERYAMWANNLIQEQPQWCLRVCSESKVQGWFLSSMQEKKGLNLTLAMLRKDAGLSGLLLYQRALAEYASRGVRIGWASFSVGNLPVLNIYSHLGARFVEASSCWLWWRNSR
ncbi:MAG TPA: hypothetical protein DEO88_18650 [Syntrophobacteraceae bacterium]|nr:hypothetical protein [Syntrophobacteraceae bacterium]